MNATVAYPQGPKCKRCGSTEKFPTGRCRPCGIARGRAWYATPEYKLYSQARDATPERQAQREQHRASEEYKEAYSLYFRRYKYGLSSEQQWELLVSQNGKCASCGEPLKPGKDTHLDHDHVTNRARGFLCCKCNVAIGMMRDSPLLLRKAAAYLELHVGEQQAVTQEHAEREPMRLSASQVQTFVDCQRKWAFKYVEGIEPPSNAAAERGSAVHSELEKYLTGGSIDFTTEIGYIAASGIEHLPKPGTWSQPDPGGAKVWTPTPGLRVEQEFHFVGPSGHSYLGYKDLETPGIVWDHKTTSDLRWQKTPEELKTDIAATLYAVDYFRNHPDENEVELRWVYYQTKNTKKSAVTRLRVIQTETWQQFLAIEKIAETMAVAATKRALDLPPTINHCSAYGGCPHQGRCNLSPFDKMRSYVEQNKLTALLKTKKNGAGAATPPATPPAAVPAAFGPGGRFAGMPAPPATPPAATPSAAAPNKLLTKMRGAGAPAATPATPAATPAAAPGPGPTTPGAITLADIQAALASGQTLSGSMAAAAQALIAQATTATAQPTAPGQINPPEFQAPPIAPPTGTVAEAGAELAGLVNGDPAATTGAGAAPRGRTKKAVVPPTGLAVKIKTLFINCGPVGAGNVVDAGQLIILAKKQIEEATGLPDYRFAEFGQGPGMLAIAVVAVLDSLEGEIVGVRLDTNTPEGSIVAVELIARAGLVVR